MKAFRIHEYGQLNVRCEKVPRAAARRHPLVVKFNAPGVAATEIERGEVVYVAIDITRHVITRKEMSHDNPL